MRRVWEYVRDGVLAWVWLGLVLLGGVLECGRTALERVLTCGVGAHDWEHTRHPPTLYTVSYTVRRCRDCGRAECRQDDNYPWEVVG